jgi:alginate O-acetyltransferase complex protein AlgI
MIFTSLSFLLFLPVAVILYNLVPDRWKVIYLLIVSYLFYINLQPVFAIILFCVSLCTFFGGKIIAGIKADGRRELALWLSIILVISPLFFYKYYDFIAGLFNSLLSSLNLPGNVPKFSLLLPVGISFYTFMAIGYLVDIYNEEIECEKNLCRTSLFLSFFPIILSGPIERAHNMLPQFKSLKNSTYDDLANGFKLILWGYFMKLCVADRLGIYVNAIYDNIPNHNGTSLAFATLLYPFQVYADLGGYSLMAIGTAKCMGIEVIQNFKRPFFATSMSEFWRRWHISLIKWLTDYIYTPLSFKLRNWKIYGIFTALMLTFFISGVWHGATFGFIIWGLIQGVFLCFDAATNKPRAGMEKRLSLTGKWWWTLVCCTIVFIMFAFSQIFGINDNVTVRDSCNVVRKIFTSWGPLFVDVNTLANGLFCLAILFIKDFKEEYYGKQSLLYSGRPFVKYFSIAMLIVIIVMFGVFDGNQFIYFQF